MKKLGEIRLGKMLQTAPSTVQDEYMPYLSAVNVQESGIVAEPRKSMWVSPREARDLDVLVGDVIVVEGGSVGRSVYLRQGIAGMVFQNSINRIRAYKDVADGRFIDYSMRALVSSGAVEMVCNKATIMHLTAEKLGRLDATVPPLDEQRTIADYLDHETTEIDAFIADQEELIALLNERRSATITQAVTKGLDPTVPMKDSGVDWLGTVANHWHVGRTKHVGTIALGKMLQPAAKGLEDVECTYLRAANVQPLGRLDLSSRKSMWFSRAELARLTLRAGDVVIVEGGVGGFGRAAYVDQDLSGWAFQNSIIRIRPASSFEGRFVNYVFLHLRDVGYIRMASSVTSMPHFTAEKVEGTVIGWPEFDEQREIADYLDLEISEIDAAIEDARQAIALSKERRAALISAAVTGKIDVRDHVSANAEGAA